MTENPSTQNQNAESNWKGWHTRILLGIVVAIPLLGYGATNLNRLFSWLIILLLLTFFISVAGHGIVGLWPGPLIDERNKLSLSRLQMTLWTIVVLSGFLAAALSNIAAGAAEPLSIALPKELWLLMGISTTSLIGSPLIKSTKKNKEPEDREKDRTLTLLASQQGVDKDKVKVESRGQIIVNATPEDAQLSELFKGEETGNAAHLDLGKVQMFFFTIILVLAYAVALGAKFAGSTVVICDFPSLDQSLVALMGISHTGYLVHKAIPHSETKRP